MPKPLSKLQEAFKAKLQGGQFRSINETLYTQDGATSFRMIQKQPELFKMYHEGFRSQVSGWPQNPLDIMISEIRRLASSSSKFVVADMGCGDGRLGDTLDARCVNYHNRNSSSNYNASSSSSLSSSHIVVHSFDLVAPTGNPFVVACDVAHVPIPDKSVDVVVFCLSLMGINYWEFLIEANRVLKPGGKLLIAEVRSRFEGGDGGDNHDNNDDNNDDSNDDNGGSSASSHHYQQVGGKKRPRDKQKHNHPSSALTKGINAFVAAVHHLGNTGYSTIRRDERNTMFVLLFFRKNVETESSLQRTSATAGAKAGAGGGSSSSSSTATSNSGSDQNKNKLKLKQEMNQKNHNDNSNKKNSAPSLTGKNDPKSLKMNKSIANDDDEDNAAASDDEDDDNDDVGEEQEEVNGAAGSTTISKSQQQNATATKDVSASGDQTEKKHKKKKKKRNNNKFKPAITSSLTLSSSSSASSSSVLDEQHKNNSNSIHPSSSGNEAKRSTSKESDKVTASVDIIASAKHAADIPNTSSGGCNSGSNSNSGKVTTTNPQISNVHHIKNNGKSNKRHQNHHHIEDKQEEEEISPPVFSTNVYSRPVVAPPILKACVYKKR